MQGTVRLEARTDQGKVKTTELITVRRPMMAGTLAEIGLTLAEAKARLSKLQARMLCDQVAEYAVRCRVCPDCGVLQPLKDRRTRRRRCCKVGDWLRKRRGKAQIRPQPRTGPRRRRLEPAYHPRQCSEPVPF